MKLISGGKSTSLLVGNGRGGFGKGRDWDGEGRERLIIFVSHPFSAFMMYNIDLLLSSQYFINTFTQNTNNSQNSHLGRIQDREGKQESLRIMACAEFFSCHCCCFQIQPKCQP